MIFSVEKRKRVGSSLLELAAEAVAEQVDVSVVHQYSKLFSKAVEGGRH